MTACQILTPVSFETNEVNMTMVLNVGHLQGHMGCRNLQGKEYSYQVWWGYIYAMISIYASGDNTCLELPKDISRTQVCL